jgi:hypothetical protein
MVSMRHEGKVKGRVGRIADCGLRIADLTAKNAARPAVTKGIEPRISQSGISAGRRNGRASRPRYP